MPQTLKEKSQKKEVAYNEVLCPFSRDCYLMQEALSEIKDNLKYSMSERRALREKLNMHERKYCNSDSNRENCPVLNLRIRV